MSHRNYIKGSEINVFADASIFNKEAIMKCLYWYGDKFHVDLQLNNSGFYNISLRLHESLETKPGDLEFYLQKLERDLIDYSLRDIISRETKNIRDLLVAKAFSNGEFDEEPQGNVSDPVGFNPNL